MHEQLTIADALLAQEAERDRGMQRAAAHNRPLPELARYIAQRHATLHDTVTIEDVRAGLDEMLPGMWEPGNWMGSVFRGDRRFVPTGRWVQTTHAGGHARPVREWRLR